MDYAKDFENEFKEQTGLVLSDVLKGTGAIEPFRKRMTRIVIEYVKESCPTFNADRLTSIQASAIQNAIIEQSYYVISTGVDMATYLGIDNVTGGVTSMEEIKARAIAPMTRKILKNAGLMFRGYGVGSGAISTYLSERMLWR